MMNKSSSNSLVTSIVIGSRYIPVWLANGFLLLLILAIAPSTLSKTSFSGVLPFTTFLALAALGQMLVIMTGGIDLSVPNVMTLAAFVTVGVGKGADDRLVEAILTALAACAVVGFANGFLVSIIRLNPLIVTLAIGQVVRGYIIEYSSGVANEASVPEKLSDWATTQFMGASYFFWVGIVITILLAVLLRSTSIGRRFQAVGANPHAAWVAGLQMKLYVLFAYVAASILYGMAGILLAGLIGSPTLGLGAPYLLAPIAAVVIGGASLTGGLASVPSTYAAAFFLTLLNQMLRVEGLSTALQFVAFGIAIVAGMIISGDRIITFVENLLQYVIDPLQGHDGEPNHPSQDSQGGNLPLRN
jgi:ribose transport system permease protein